jgi:hypothetical protein
MLPAACLASPAAVCPCLLCSLGSCIRPGPTPTYFNSSLKKCNNRGVGVGGGGYRSLAQSRRTESTNIQTEETSDSRLQTAGNSH